jgi:hypothetical protein
VYLSFVPSCTSLTSKIYDRAAIWYGCGCCTRRIAAARRVAARHKTNGQQSQSTAADQKHTQQQSWKHSDNSNTEQQKLDHKPQSNSKPCLPAYFRVIPETVGSRRINFWMPPVPPAREIISAYAVGMPAFSRAFACIANTSWVSGSSITTDFW